MTIQWGTETPKQAGGELPWEIYLGLMRDACGTTKRWVEHWSDHQLAET